MGFAWLVPVQFITVLTTCNINFIIVLFYKRLYIVVKNVYERSFWIRLEPRLNHAFPLICASLSHNRLLSRLKVKQNSLD